MNGLLNSTPLIVFFPNYFKFFYQISLFPKLLKIVANMLYSNHINLNKHPQKSCSKVIAQPLVRLLPPTLYYS